MKFVDKIGQLVARFFPKAIYRQIQKLAVMGLILYLILFKTNLGKCTQKLTLPDRYQPLSI